MKKTANDQFKQLFGSIFWGSLTLATGLHFALFWVWPEMTVADVSIISEEVAVLELPPEVEIPPPPEKIVRPAVPVVADVQNIEEDITIAPTTFEANPVDVLPPPPSEKKRVDISKEPTFTPFTVRPQLKNTAEVRRALEREYPPLLRDAGIGGTVILWFFIDEQGRVLKAQIFKSSGHKALGEAALHIAPLYKFSPALNRDKRVKVWVQIPITFTTK